MKNPKTYLGDLGLQVTFHFPQRKTYYRTITYPERKANPYDGNRACLNLTTNKAVNLECKRVVTFPVLKD